MTVRRMGMVRGLLVRIGLMMLGCFAMMLGGMLVMLGSFLVMLDDLVFGHGDLRRGVRHGSRRAMLHRGDRSMSAGGSLTSSTQSGVTPKRRCQNSRDRRSPMSQPSSYSGCTNLV